MIVDFWLLPLALILLWLPRPWLRHGDKVVPKTGARPDGRARIAREPGDDSLRVKDEAKKPRNWLDFARAAVGAFMIQPVCFQPAADAAAGAGTWIFVVECAICVVAVLIQMIRVEGRLMFVAPVFFIGGLGLGILGWLPGLFAFVAIWVINLVLPGPSFFLFLFSGLLGVFGFFLSSHSLRYTALVSGLSLLPVVISLMTKRRLVQLGKRTKSSRRHK